MRLSRSSVERVNWRAINREICRVATKYCRTAQLPRADRFGQTNPTRRFWQNEPEGCTSDSWGEACLAPTKRRSRQIGKTNPSKNRHAGQIGQTNPTCRILAERTPGAPRIVGARHASPYERRGRVESAERTQAGAQGSRSIRAHFAELSPRPVMLRCRNAPSARG